jgi:hypothetical protein
MLMPGLWRSQRYFVPCEQGVGDGRPLPGHFGQAVRLAKMGDECERPVKGGHRTNAPVGLGIRRDGHARETESR